MERLENRWISVACHIETGYMDITDRTMDSKVLVNAFMAVRLEGPDAEKLILSSFVASETSIEKESIDDGYGRGTSLIATYSFPNGFLIKSKLTLYEDRPTLFVQAAVQGTITGYKLDAIYPLVVSQSQKGLLELGGVKDWRVFCQDWQSWSTAQVIPLNKRMKRTWLKVPKIIVHSTQEKLKKGEYLSDNVASIKNLATQQFITMGAISMCKHLTHIELKVNYRKNQLLEITMRSLAGKIPLPAKAEVNSEKFALILNGMSAIESLSSYATLVQKEMGATSWSGVPVGWCTWYYYFTRVSQEAVLQNLKFLATRKDLPIEYVQVDDGYFPARGFNSRIGDWLEVNKRFPRGLEWLANEIRAEGFQPGLWLAPFIVSKASDLYQQHPDWIIRNSKGDPIVVNIPVEWGTFNKIYALDTTHPGVQEWLRRIFTKIVKEWGFRFLKLDFIYGAAIEGRRYDPTQTRIEAYRRGLEIIRETVGDDIFILGCGAPLGPSIGLVNGMRVSGDTFFAFNQPILYWFLNHLFFAGLGEQPSMVSALKTTMVRSFMHQKFWLNDPDCLLVRQKRSLLKQHEIEFEVTFMGLCGGILLSSDNLPELRPQDLEYIKFLLPANETSAVPIDLFEHSPPSYYKLEIDSSGWFDSYHLIGVFNWTKKDQTVPLSPQEFQLDSSTRYHAFDFWEKRYYQIDSKGAHVLLIKKNRVKLLVIRPVTDLPQLIASTFHLTSGAREISQFKFNPESQELVIAIAKPGWNEGRLYLSIPAPYREKEILSNAPRANMFSHPDGLVIIELGFENSAQVTLKLG